MTTPTSLVWFRQDLRLTDNPALLAASQRGAVVPVFIWSPEEEKPWAPASASRWWLHHSLQSLSESLSRLGVPLILRRGPVATVLEALARETGAQAIYWNRRYEPAVIARDKELKAHLQKVGYSVESFNSALLFEPWEVQTKQGRPFQVYTPFWNACRTAGSPPAKPLPSPKQLQAVQRASSIHSLPLKSLSLEPSIDWASGMRQHWQPGEAGAQKRFRAFLDRAIRSYHEHRDLPHEDGTSSLSPHLHFGEISPRTLWHSLCPDGQPDQLGPGQEVYLKELVWREFAYQLLYHFPHTTKEPLRSEFTSFPYRHDPQALRAWQRGRTGYPLVDAGMRQLWHIGWMHNRVRMVVASFLIKHLLLPWQQGAEWFWDTLVDADLASNTLGWQWSAGCGADAAPYFRIFNPTSQGEKFDSEGLYIRRWIPELARLPDRYIHQPWQAPASVLHDAGVVLGENYPLPIVEHSAARQRALDALAQMSKTLR